MIRYWLIYALIGMSPAPRPIIHSMEVHDNRTSIIYTDNLSLIKKIIVQTSQVVISSVAMVPPGEII